MEQKTWNGIILKVSFCKNRLFIAIIKKKGEEENLCILKAYHMQINKGSIYFRRG